MMAECRFYMLLTLFTLAALVPAQVTFSRDWSGGKRSQPMVFDCGQFARLCRHFLHDLKSAVMSTDNFRKQQRTETQELPTAYEDEK